MTFEYKVVQTILVSEFEARCNDLGKDNWELVGVTSQGSKVLAVFKKYIAP